MMWLSASEHSHTVPTLSAWRMRRVSAWVYAMLWYDTSTAADAMLRVTTLCRYARVYCLHAWQLQVGSIGLVWGIQVWGTKRVDTEMKRVQPTFNRSLSPAASCLPNPSRPLPSFTPLASSCQPFRRGCKSGWLRT